MRLVNLTSLSADYIFRKFKTQCDKSDKNGSTWKFFFSLRTFIHLFNLSVRYKYSFSLSMALLKLQNVGRFTSVDIPADVREKKRSLRRKGTEDTKLASQFGPICNDLETQL